MLQWVKKVPAGTFLVPLLISSICYTLWPDLFYIGGMTEAFMTRHSINFILAALTFCSGAMINMTNLKKVLKREGAIALLKATIAISLGVLILKLFGHDGFFGLSSLALVITLCSANPAIFLSLVTDYAQEENKIGFSVLVFFGIPILPLLIYSIGMAGDAGFNWLPLISTLVPLILGVMIGNMDPGAVKLFSPGVPLLLPLLGWGIGQTMNIIDSLQSGLLGILLVVFFYLVTSPLYLFDKYILKNDGVVGMAFNSMLGSAASFPALIAQSYPGAESHTTQASAQLLTGVIITAFVTSVIVDRIHKRAHHSNKNKSTN